MSESVDTAAILEFRLGLQTEDDRLVVELCDEVDRLRADLAKYGGHTEGCRARYFDAWMSWREIDGREGPAPEFSCHLDCGWADR